MVSFWQLNKSSLGGEQQQQQQQVAADMLVLAEKQQQQSKRSSSNSRLKDQHKLDLLSSSNTRPKKESVFAGSMHENQRPPGHSTSMYVFVL